MSVARPALTAPYVLEYTYRRSVGPVLGAFLAGLRDSKILGSKTASGRVLVPPSEYDPETSEPIAEMVDIASTGVVTTWTWVDIPRAHHPLAKPFAWALVKLDGADTALLHAVEASSHAAMKSGMRVRARWRATRTGAVTDIECFERIEGEATR
jgi:uncharacterized OB-fold protein